MEMHVSKKMYQFPLLCDHYWGTTTVQYFSKFVILYFNCRLHSEENAAYCIKKYFKDKTLLRVLVHFCATSLEFCKRLSGEEEGTPQRNSSHGCEIS